MKTQEATEQLMLIHHQHQHQTTLKKSLPSSSPSRIEKFGRPLFTFCNNCQKFSRQNLARPPNFVSHFCERCQRTRQFSAMNSATQSFDETGSDVGNCSLNSNENQTPLELTNYGPLHAKLDHSSQQMTSGGSTSSPPGSSSSMSFSSAAFFAPPPQPSAVVPSQQLLPSSSSSLSNNSNNSRLLASPDGPSNDAQTSMTSNGSPSDFSFKMPDGASPQEIAQKLILNVIRDVDAALSTWRPSFVEFVILKAMLFYRTGGPFFNAHNMSLVSLMRNQLSRTLHIYFSKTHRNPADADKSMQQFFAVHNMMLAVSQMRGEALERVAQENPAVCGSVLSLVSELVDDDNDDASA